MHNIYIYIYRIHEQLHIAKKYILKSQAIHYMNYMRTGVLTWHYKGAENITRICLHSP